MRNYLLILALLICQAFSALATHQRAGEITYRHLYGLTYEVTILTYTFAPSPADRPELLIDWGDGTSDILPRSVRIDLPNDLRRNEYVGQHTYSAPDVYIISLEDPNRNYGIINIPNSVNVPLYIESELVINPFLGPNNSPILSIPPIDNGCVFIPFIHNPGAYDQDGDSLSYRLVACRGAGGQVIPGYTLPPATTSFTLDPVTGDLLWDAPPFQGEFNIAILIEEWRNGVKVGSVLRDMQVTIAACNQQPPEIKAINDTCVDAGSLLTIPVTATDPDGDWLMLSASGAPLSLPVSPAQFDTVYGFGSITYPFTWQTQCAHVRLQPYTVYFRVQDDGLPVNLIDLETMQITVVGPAPENLTADALGNGINLSWDPSPCSNAVGYHVYRRVDSSGFIPGPCETGVPAYTGYQWITSLDGIDSTSYRDNEQGIGLTHGKVYCYLVVAYYPDGALSYASNEACASLRRDVPILINNSIRRTDEVNGSVFVRWVRPTELDPVQTPGPFRYRILRSTAGGAFQVIDSLDGLFDTTYIDTILNTALSPVSYDIELLNLTPGNVFDVGRSGPASSVFLSIVPTDRRLILNWSATTPWTNHQFVVHRYEPDSGAFVPLDTVNIATYTDTGLVNQQEYCYRIEAIGAFARPDLPGDLINWSQEACARPFDDVPPCVPYLEVTTDCDIPANILSWDALAPGCPDDIAEYQVFYASRAGEDPVYLATVEPGDNTSFTHSSLAGIAGCYYVRAIDSLGNESDFSQAVCVDIDVCGLYRLPNVFTPNADGFNDEFTPFPYTSVESVRMTIFNRWGGIVYETTDPDIRWDGRHRDNGQACNEGVYYYVCDVLEIRLEGPVKRTIQGVVHLLR